MLSLIAPALSCKQASYTTTKRGGGIGGVRQDSGQTIHCGNTSQQSPTVVNNPTAFPVGAAMSPKVAVSVSGGAVKEAP